MYKLGQREVLQIKKIKDSVILAKRNESDVVQMDLLELAPDEQVGDAIEVFIYNVDDTLHATKKTPKIKLHQMALLECKETTRIGAFFDWGLEKDLLLPFSEQLKRVEKNKFYMVYLYIDKSNRLCLTMRVRGRLKRDSSYKRDDRVEGIIYNIVDDLGAFVAVDGIYEAMIGSENIVGALEIGETIQARVTKVKPDGRLDLAIRNKGYRQMHHDCDVIEDLLLENDGFLPYNDKSDPEEIKRVFQMSKAGFKRAVGSLLKQGKIEFSNNGIQRRKNVR